jgi:putative SOS response-associated peptidase YedK
MCGRFALFDNQKLYKRYGVHPGPTFDVPDRYNVAPYSVVPVFSEESDEIELMHWGLLPFYEKDSVKGRRIINTMSETAEVKAAFKNALKHRRCIVPANGFYEWSDTPDGKRPHYFFPADDNLFSFAGLYEVRPDAEGRPYKTFTIITVPANETVGTVHNRMPAILTPHEERDWLNPDITESNQLKPLLHPYPNELMLSRQVSPLVNNTRNDGPELLNAPS